MEDIEDFIQLIHRDRGTNGYFQNKTKYKKDNQGRLLTDLIIRQIGCRDIVKTERTLGKYYIPVIQIENFI
jgi:hypothetical protein